MYKSAKCTIASFVNGRELNIYIKREVQDGYYDTLVSIKKKTVAP